MAELTTSSQILGMLIPKIIPIITPLGVSPNHSPHGYLLAMVCISQGRLNAVTNSPNIPVAFKKMCFLPTSQSSWLFIQKYYAVIPRIKSPFLQWFCLRVLLCTFCIQLGHQEMSVEIEYEEPHRMSQCPSQEMIYIPLSRPQSCGPTQMQGILGMK